MSRVAARARVLLLAPILVGVSGIPAATSAEHPTEPLARVEHHLREAGQIAQHFEGVLAQDCPRFASPAEWESYLDREIDRVVTLVAHVEQAWVEAKRTKDDDVRRTAKAPRKRLDQARLLVDKLQACAADNGTTFVPLSVWRRIEREVPPRQAAIALPR